MFKKSYSCLIFLGLFSNASFALDVVYDPVNYAENAATAANSAIMQAKDILIEDHTLKSMVQLKKEYDMLNQNLQELKGVKNYLQKLDIKQNLSKYYGSAALSQLSTLDPNSSGYEQQRDNILKQYFQKPSDPNVVQSEFQGALSQSDINAMKNQVQAENNDYQVLQDSIDESTHAEDKAQQRQSNITQYQGALDSGNLSQQQVAQATGIEMNMALEQNEQNIAMQNEALKYLRMQKAYQDSENAKESQAQETSLERAINQGSSGLGRSSWGNF